MIEPEAVIEPGVVPPGPDSRRRRRAVVAGATLLAVVAGGVAVAAGGGRSEPKPLALMAGNGAGRGLETFAPKAGAPSPAAPALGAPADALYPYGGWGLKFEVEGNLPELPDHAAAWRVTGPDLDRAAVARIAEALGLQGAPVQRDGGWFVDGGDWSLSAYGGDAMGKGGAWYLNLSRTRYDGRPDDAAGAEPPAGPAISRADAERRVLDLLDRMGAPRASWTVETTDTEIGVGWACATPTPALSPEELNKLEAEKLRQLEQPNAPGVGTAPAANSSNAATVAVDPPPPAGSAARTAPARKPAPDGGVASCPPPPAPVRGFNVALRPVLDGRRADWPVWNVTMRSDGRIENLSGSWVTLVRGGNYRLRGVDDALNDLQSPAQPIAALAMDTSARAIEPAPAVGMPDIAPVCPLVPAPMAEDAKAAAAAATTPTCVPPSPQVVKIMGVELGLIQTSVFEDGKVRLALVPSYRFVGHFENGSPWETSVIALHPDAIAPPPDFPVGDDVRSGGGGATGVGKAVPPTPAPEPAVVTE